jgi:hypothetical protein
MKERKFTVVKDDGYKENHVKDFDVSTVEPTLFAKKYPKMLKYLLDRKDNVRFDFSIAMLQMQLADNGRLVNKHKMGTFFARSPYHTFIKLLVTKNAIERFQEGSSRLGTPISDLKTLFSSDKPSLRTRERIINEAVDAGYFLKTKSKKGIQTVVPTDTFLAAHMIENRARLEAILSSQLIEFIQQADWEITEAQWLPDFNYILSDKQKDELNWEDMSK